jgi:hypothetical protein
LHGGEKPAALSRFLVGEKKDGLRHCVEVMRKKKLLLRRRRRLLPPPPTPPLGSLWSAASLYPSAPRLLSPLALIRPLYAACSSSLVLVLALVLVLVPVLEVLAARRQAPGEAETRQRASNSTGSSPHRKRAAPPDGGGALRMKRRALELLLVRCLELWRARQGTASPPRGHRHSSTTERALGGWGGTGGCPPPPPPRGHRVRPERRSCGQ